MSSAVHIQKVVFFFFLEYVHEGKHCLLTCCRGLLALHGAETEAD